MKILKIYWSKQPKDKVWIRVSKKVDKRAVVRNRVKRKIRAAISDTPLHSNVIISALPNIVNYSVEEIKTEVQKIIGRWCNR